jgi:hypothetical protein
MFIVIFFNFCSLFLYLTHFIAFPSFSALIFIIINIGFQLFKKFIFHLSFHPLSFLIINLSSPVHKSFFLAHIRLIIFFH